MTTYHMAPSGLVHRYDPCDGDVLVAVVPVEDREQVERLADELHHAKVGHRLGNCYPAEYDQMAAALRGFADPTPPKPVEPLGLGAVIEDSAGVLWTRTEKPNMTGTVWVSAFHATRADQSVLREYAAINAVCVIHEGVTL